MEAEYARYALPRGVLDLNAAMSEEYLRFITTRRLARIGLPEAFTDAENPLPWMRELVDLKKEKNFFETRVTLSLEENKTPNTSKNGLLGTDAVVPEAGAITDAIGQAQSHCHEVFPILGFDV